MRKSSPSGPRNSPPGKSSKPRPGPAWLRRAGAGPAGSGNRRQRPQPGDARRRRQAGRVGPGTFRQADALDLPFEDESFDLVVCQFGVMFYPDKVRGNAEARRVLRDGGRYLFAIWDGLDHNPLSEFAHQTMERASPITRRCSCSGVRSVTRRATGSNATWTPPALPTFDRNRRADEPQRLRPKMARAAWPRFADAGRARGIWPRSARLRLRRPDRGRAGI